MTRTVTVELSQIDSIPKLTTESAIIGMAIKSEISVRMMMDGGGADILVGLEEGDLESGVEVNAIIQVGTDESIKDESIRDTVLAKKNERIRKRKRRNSTVGTKGIYLLRAGIYLWSSTDSCLTQEQERPGTTPSIALTLTSEI
jgi:hypothetical protein